MKFIRFYIFALIFSLAISAIFAVGDSVHKRDLLLDFAPYVLGSSLVFMLIPLIFIGLVVLVLAIFKRKLSKGVHSTIFSTVWLLMAFNQYNLQQFEKNYPDLFHFSPSSTVISTNQARSEFLFTTKNCDYSLKFPNEPSYQKSFDPNIGEFITASYSPGGKETEFFLRAECVGIPDVANSELNSKDTLQKMIIAYAESNGLRYSEYHYGEGKLGKYVNARGLKEISGILVTYEAYMYVGNNSLLSIYVGGASSSYPQAPVYAFLRSVEKK